MAVVQPTFKIRCHEFRKQLRVQLVVVVGVGVGTMRNLSIFISVPPPVVLDTDV
jgi:hypothetical protein